MVNNLFGLVLVFTFIPFTITGAEDLIRLAGSDGYCSGRVEIYHNGAWGTVCDDKWETSDAQVVCRQLGCGQVSDIPPPGYFGPGTGPIWMDDVSCSGSETSLSTCSHRGFGTHNCEHYEDAGVICSYNKIVPYGSCNGYIQIYHDRGWWLVGNSFNMNAAEVACRQMGCGPALSICSASNNYNYNGMTCSGKESSLEECEGGSVVKIYGRYFGVQCKGHPVRLIGPSRCSGRVEIYYSDGWGTVCDNGWDMNDAQVVCRQLGCGTAVAAPHSAYFGKGMDKIWVDNVNCTGMEAYLTECPFSGFQTYSRSHGQDAGVICSAGVLRLVGPNRCSGRVEIYNNGSWATVCNVSKDFNDGRVICRQLGCGTALGLLHFGEGAGQIWLDDVTCTGSERNFYECLQSGSVRQDCAHSEDLGVICSGLMKPTITITPQSDISFGQNVSITCLVPNGQVGGTFIFNRTSDRFGQTVESNSNSGTFYIPQIGFEHEGTYQCQFHTRVSNEDFSTAVSSPVQLYSNVFLPQPSISLDPAGVITLGQLVAITCSISTQFLNGSFILQKYQPYSYQNISTQSSSTNFSTFRFLEVNSDHVGNYQCFYQKTVASRTLTSPTSENVVLSITAR